MDTVYFLINIALPNKGGVYRKPPCLSLRLSVHMSCKHNSSHTDEPLLMTLDTVEVYDQTMCMKKEKTCPDYFQGDN